MPNANQNRVPIQILKPEVIEELSKPLDEVSAQQADSYQFIVHRLNDVLHKHGLEWTTQDNIQRIETDDGSIEYAGKVTLMFLDENRNVVASRHCYGGNFGEGDLHGEAMRLAFLNGLCKAAALFEVGVDLEEK